MPKRNAAATAAPAPEGPAIERFAVRVLTPLQDGPDRYEIGETVELSREAIAELLALSPAAVEVMPLPAETPTETP